MESLDLTPAESLMIISQAAGGDEMIKFTLIDLLLKKSLKLNTEDKPPFLKRSHDNMVFSVGEQSKISLKPHEEILMELILEYRELKLNEFKNEFAKKIRSSTEYKNKYIRDPLVEKGYLKRQRKMLLALAPYTVYVLTDSGLEAKSKVIELLDEAGNLEKWMKEDLGRARSYLAVLGSHILLTDYDIEDIKKFNRILSYLKPEFNTRKYYDYYIYTVPPGYLDDYGNLKSLDFLDISLLDYFDSFDDFCTDFDDENEGIQRSNKI
jgi:hypothetical protein